ncbi:MAG: 30S ribosomal protein S4 [Pelagibacteraceae bacterium]|jgi:small subunit ribosomal protein S4|nr:MAG: 30S ribosomal protein S4 [Pelagibacteraceae bacterium]|tara:strand:+ start:1581 stop:2198 length:618 start_codon:yes stop_codon:yes gene_type:complete
MTKRLSSKHKIDRRLGLNLWGRPKSPFNRRPYGPGQHGQARRRKPSDFGVQLAAKQKLKKYYGDITEKQFLKIYQAASRKKGDTSQILIELLERRLDAVVFRLKFAPTVFSARQLVNHGHVLVNGKVVNKKSYQVNDGDEISLQQTSQNIPMIIQTLSSNERDVPEYLQLEISKCLGKFVRGPQLTDVPYPVQMEPNLVVEFYSR